VRLASTAARKDKARAAAEKALQLDPGIAEVVSSSFQGIKAKSKGQRSNNDVHERVFVIKLGFDSFRSSIM
jgi:hypothetical protein